MIKSISPFISGRALSMVWKNMRYRLIYSVFGVVAILAIAAIAGKKIVSMTETVTRPIGFALGIFDIDEEKILSHQFHYFAGSAIPEFINYAHFDMENSKLLPEGDSNSIQDWVTPAMFGVIQDNNNCVDQRSARELFYSRCPNILRGRDPWGHAIRLNVNYPTKFEVRYKDGSYKSFQSLEEANGEPLDKIKSIFEYRHYVITLFSPGRNGRDEGGKGDDIFYSRKWEAYFQVFPEPEKEME